ncbi:TVP38/TMEM64 family protein [Limosilactobacillus caccae]|uniref:TVP38/TMEM64 family protein n=1 Tax=Limosilactobacillus caccae TaxID=1926284 RepID=UPI0009709F33|nr:VTT domain-containing protein [Limosilactobacillus caccae]
MKERRLNKTALIIGAVLLSLIILYFIYRTYRPDINLLLNMDAGNNRAKLLHMIRSHGFVDMFLLVALIAVFNAIPGMSNSVVCIFTGLCYGPLVGFILNWAGNILGNCAVMSIIRRIDLSKRMKKSKLLDYLMHQKHPLIGLTIGFMIPVIPSVLVNYSGARLNVDRKHFLAMVAVGMAPTSFLYAFGGDAIFKGNIKRIIAVVIAIIVILALYFLIKKVWQHEKEEREQRA